MTKLTIGIIGGSASGKSTYAHNLKKFIKDINKDLKIIIISMDNFYKGLSSFSQEENDLFKNNDLNFDEPSIINFTTLIKLIKDLQHNFVPTQMPIYERIAYDVTSYEKLNEEYDIIIIEGIFIFNNQEIINMIDLKIFIDVPNDKRLERRLKRYQESKMDEQTTYYNKFTVPAYNKYINPQKSICDFIIDGEKEFNNTLIPPLIFKIFYNTHNSK